MTIVVAVSQRVDAVPGREEIRDGIDQRLVNWISQAGGLPFPVPNGLTPGELAVWIGTLKPRAIVLSGGADLGAFPLRDASERLLLDHAASRELPVLGICRGMQMMAVWLGCELQRVSGHVGVRHLLQGKLTGEVNSFHEWGLAASPPDCEVLAVAEDGSIEAMRHLIFPWEAWMWHPERERVFSAPDIDRARHLFSSQKESAPA